MQGTCTGKREASGSWGGEWSGCGRRGRDGHRALDLEAWALLSVGLSVDRSITGSWEIPWAPGEQGFP